MSESLKITISLDNDAFQPDPAPEIARILRNLADKIEQGNETPTILDVNGNKVGMMLLFRK